MKKKLDVEDADKALSDGPLGNIKPQNEQIEPMNSERNIETNRGLIEDGQIEEVAGSEPKQSNMKDRLGNQLNVDTNMNNLEEGSFNQEKDKEIKLEDEEQRKEEQVTIEDSINNTLNSSYIHTIQAKVIKYMSESSLFLFHKDTYFRKFMIKLTTAPIQKTVTQKDILLSQIQNGGVQDDDSEDEEEEGNDYDAAKGKDQNLAHQDLALDQQKSAADNQNPNGENTVLSPETAGTLNIGGN